MNTNDQSLWISHSNKNMKKTQNAFIGFDKNPSMLDLNTSGGLGKVKLKEKDLWIVLSSNFLVFLFCFFVNFVNGLSQWHDYQNLSKKRWDQICFCVQNFVLHILCSKFFYTHDIFQYIFSVAKCRAI